MRRYVVPFLRSTLAGVLTASFLPFLFAVVILIASIVTGEPTQALVTLYVFVIALACITAVITSVSLMIGLPTSILLRRLGQYTKRAHVVAGVILGFLAFPVLFATTGDQEGDASFLLLYVYSALAGGVTADSWWRNTSALVGRSLKPA
ncbi:hypothetical protein [Novosphingobium taihuense]|uniref:Uncharacterized protein n=1 Tax=Novosphingobium taihuense TaxID=260085 RepID=A0A7W7EV93_9SPHN|nr:hypothetical protein [Novosphingobium taihuense]MBB4615213.1 hypothetical protein [Novosphingobium taihuense]TWH84248.1 hypothetical protein IQ25_02674 [Novosphingobium taihuense]